MPRMGPGLRLISSPDGDIRDVTMGRVWYHDILVPTSRELLMAGPSKHFEIERVQTGVRIERRILKVLKALAEYRNLTLGDLLEGIVLHAFEGKAAFAPETLR